jgi:tetratricopeptide (TPR) repeat protein/DNA-binding CsgD family transcriptional regulator
MHLLKRYFSLLTFLAPSLVFAQYEHLLHKSYAQKMIGIHSMYKDMSDLPDSVQRVEKAEAIKNFARQHQDMALAQNVDFFMVFWDSFYQRQPREVSLIRLKEQLDLYTENNVDFLRLRSLRALAEFYWKIEKNYELAFEQYLLMDSDLATVNPTDYPEMARDWMQIGEAFYHFQDYALATKYFKRAIVLPEISFTTLVINNAKNTLGLCYQEMGDLDSSDYYFKEVLKTPFPEAKVWKRIATGNLGTNMYLRKNYDSAIPLLETDFYGSLEENDYGCAAGASILLADIFREKGKLKQSAEFIAHAQDHIKKAEQPDRYRLLYPVMSKWYAATGNIKQSVQYADSSVAALKRYNDRFSALKVLRAQQRVNHQNQALQLAAFTLERQQKIAERNLLTLLVLILCIVLVLTYFIQKKRQLAKDIKLQAAKQEMEIAVLNLNRFTESILGKNKLIEQLQSRSDEAGKLQIFQELQQSKILTEDDWQSFQQLFDKAYPGFIGRFKEKYPELSVGELRYFVLRRLNLSTREMATMLGVSTNAVQVMRHRIAKKLNLSDNTSLIELIKMT